eukprot:COSAG01_NODE_6034_length_3888_cov_9.383215_2_plen_98_part_00
MSSFVVFLTFHDEQSDWARACCMPVLAPPHSSSGLQQGLLAFEVQQPPPSGRPPWSWRRINPFLPLKHLRTSSLMGWLAIVVFFSSLPESGILEASL